MDDTPRQVGRYQVLARIPGGGMTRVFLARVADSRGPERLLVLKLLPEALADDPAARARFVEEARIALALSHGNVVSTFEAAHDDAGRPFLVMEYVHGRSLRELLSAGPLPLGLALFVAREVARALRYTHTFVDPVAGPAPIAHLDVSPENVFVSFAGNVKLGDFGIARAVGTVSGAGGAYGKAPYAAPEVIRGAPGGPAADVYGLGCVVYEMVAGRPPRRGKDAGETLRMAAEGAEFAALSEVVGVAGAGVTGVPGVPGVDAEVDGLVARLLADDPGVRFADGGEVERALTGALARHGPLLTEADLAGFMAGRAAEAPAVVPEDRARLEAQLVAAGVVLSGGEDTSRLLALGTVPIGGADSVDAGVGAAEELVQADRRWLAERRGQRETRFSGWMVLGLAPFVVLIGALAWGQGFFGGSRRGAVAEPTLQVAEPARETRGAVPEAAPGAQGSPPAADGNAGGGGRETSGETGAPGPGQSDIPSGRDSRQHSGTPPAPTVRPEVAVPHATTPTARKEPAAVSEGAVAPAPPALEPAFLRINAFPYAEVHLDGEPVGTTPLRELEVAPGAHVLRFVNPELGLSREVPVDLAAGERRTVGVRLDR